MKAGNRGGRLADIPLQADQVEFRNGLGKIREDLRGWIGRAVIHNDDLESAGRRRIGTSGSLAQWPEHPHNLFDELW